MLKKKKDIHENRVSDAFGLIEMSKQLTVILGYDHMGLSFCPKNDSKVSQASLQWGIRSVEREEDKCERHLRNTGVSCLENTTAVLWTAKSVSTVTGHLVTQISLKRLHVLIVKSLLQDLLGQVFVFFFTTEVSITSRLQNKNKLLESSSSV